HAPFPGVESDGALDDLHDATGVAPSDLAVAPHEAGALARGQIVPVHLLAAALRHRIEAEVALSGDPRIEARARELLHLLAQRLVEALRAGLDPAPPEHRGGVSGELVGAPLDHREAPLA